MRSLFTAEDLLCKPVTSQEWTDLEMLFSEHGVQNGCWCMYWRTTRKEFHQNYGDSNKKSFKQIVESGQIPGILAYHMGKPVGWCSVAPRQDFPVLGRSPTLKPIDDQAVWSITCFFISRPYRRGRITHMLIKAAVQYAKEQGAHIIEAYPIDPNVKSIEYERYLGLTTTFEEEGFQEAIRRSKRRLIMRYFVK